MTDRWKYLNKGHGWTDENFKMQTYECTKNIIRTNLLFFRSGNKKRCHVRTPMYVPYGDPFLCTDYIENKYGMVTDVCMYGD